MILLLQELWAFDEKNGVQRLTKSAIMQQVLEQGRVINIDTASSKGQNVAKKPPISPADDIPGIITCQVCPAVLPFQPKHRLGHPEN